MSAEVYSSASSPIVERAAPRLVSAAALTGDKVVDREGRALGRITEIMLDVPAGRIAYVVMSSGGFLGLGDKLLALPWSALTLDAEQKCFVMDADEARLREAPVFDPSRAAEPGPFEEMRRIHSYWGSQPYWD